MTTPAERPTPRTDKLRHFKMSEPAMPHHEHDVMERAMKLCDELERELAVAREPVPEVDAFIAERGIHESSLQIDWADTFNLARDLGRRLAEANLRVAGFVVKGIRASDPYLQAKAADAEEAEKAALHRAEAAESKLTAISLERDLHYNRCAALIFSDTFKNVTGGEAQQWATEYADCKSKLASAVAKYENEHAKLNSALMDADDLLQTVLNIVMPEEYPQEQHTLRKGLAAAIRGSEREGGGNG